MAGKKSMAVQRRTGSRLTVSRPRHGRGRTKAREGSVKWALNRNEQSWASGSTADSPGDSIEQARVAIQSLPAVSSTALQEVYQRLFVILVDFEEGQHVDGWRAILGVLHEQGFKGAGRSAFPFPQPLMSLTFEPKKFAESNFWAECKAEPPFPIYTAR
jgi:hypothetical protein